MDAVRTEALHKHYGKVTALNGVSFQVDPGETFGLLGPNGAGKTTLQQILCTLAKPSEGRAFVDGIDVRLDPEAVRRRLGVVFQVQTLDPIMSAEENLRIHGKLYKVPAAELDRSIPDLLELAQLGDRARDRVNTFSGGMRRRLEIVRALLHKPKILLLDEPTIGLDPQSRRLIWERLSVMKKEYGITVLLTTHYMDEADSLCDRIAVIDHGEIIALDTPDGLKKRLGGDRLELTVQNHLNGNVATAIQSVANVMGVTAVDDGARLTVRLREAGRTVPDVLAAVHGTGAVVTDMRHHAMTMDDVFLDLTGKVRDQLKRQRRTKSWAGLVRGLFGGSG